MKKYFYSLFAAASMMLAVTSCSQDEVFEQNSSGNMTTFSVNLDGVVGSRAGEGTLATELHYEVHRIMADGSIDEVADYQTVDLTSTKNVPITLLNGERYNIIFWAQAPDNTIYNVDDLQNITVNYENNADLLANQEVYDAFYNALANFKADGKTHTVTLRRPFAQLNLGANDWEAAKAELDVNDKYPVNTTSVKIAEGLATNFNALTGEASGSTGEITFALNKIPAGKFTVNSTDYKYLSANYLLIPGVKTPNGLGDYVAETECKTTLDLEFVLKRGDNEILNVEVPNAPVQRNWRTNVIGALLTGGNSFDIVIDSTFDNDENINEPVVGLSALNEALKAYKEEAPVIYNVTGLSTLTADKVAEIVIPTGFKAAKVTFNLEDIKGTKLTVKDENTSNPYVNTVVISIPEDTDLASHELTLPGAHVELLGGHYGSGIVSTSSSTLVLRDGATIGELTVLSGNVEIQTGSAVESIEAGSGNTVIVTLGENVEAPEVEGEGVDLKDANGDNFVAVGVSQKEGDDDTYYISNAEGLKWLATTTNDGNTFKNKTIKLAADIDLNNEQWTSAGTEANPFSGTFDGDGKTIKNLSVIETEAKEGKAYIGFFGYAKDVTIMNVTFENVNINIPCLDIDHSQGHIGAVAGSLEGTSTIENVTVKGDIKVYATQDANGASRVAVVAGGNSYGDVTMKNVKVEANEGSYLKANNNTGALAGQLQGKMVFENCSSNIDVTVNKFFAGGLVGIAAADSEFINCHTTGDVAVVAGRAGRANDHYRVGGIAGGWADGKKNVCTLTGCSYTGKVSGTNADGSVTEGLDYAGYVGRGYTLTNCAGSKVIIDGVEYVQAYDKEFGVYTIDGVYEMKTLADMQWLANKVNTGADYFEGKTIKLANDIDLNNVEWTPIGSASMDHGFMGNFDGNGKSIKNLSITNITPDSDGYVYAGLFGVTEGIDKDNQNYIKNLTIENVTISTEGHIVAAAIAYPYYTTVENITVTGNIKIIGGDYTSGVLAYTRRCVNAMNLTIEGNEGSIIEGKQTVGGVISDIQTNGGLTANYSNFTASGLTIKGEKCVGGISGIICEQTLNGATVENVTIECEDDRTGIISGADGGKATITNVSYENVKGATRVIGATYKGGYYVGKIVEYAGNKAVIFSTEGGVKAVSVAELNLKGKTLSDATTWATDLGEGWALASIEELDAIHTVRKTLNVALSADNADNALFCEEEYYTDKEYAKYLSSTEATGNDPQGQAYFANRVHYKYFNLNGYWDYPLSTHATISKSAPLKDNHFARAVYLIE